MSTYHPTRPANRGGFQSKPPPGHGQTVGSVPHQLPQGYLQKGYFDDKGNLLKEVILDWPKEIAQSLDQAGMSSSQLRGSFFTEVRRIETKLKAVRDYDTVCPEVLKLIAFAADRAKEGKDKVPMLFKQFIEANVRWAARSQKDFEGFLNHFECVAGFFPAKRGR